MTMQQELVLFASLFAASSLIPSAVGCVAVGPSGPVVRSTVAAPACAPITGAEARAAKEDVTDGAVPSAPQLASLRGPATVKVGSAPSHAIPDGPAPITGAGRTGRAWILGLVAPPRRRAAVRTSGKRMRWMRLLLLLLLWLACC